MDTWTIEKLNSAHEREPFSSGNPVLDTFLKTLAGQYAKKRVGRTYVATLPGSPRVCGYYTVAASSFSFDTLPEAVRKRLPRHPIPSIHLGRLAVDVNHRGCGLGKNLLFHCLRQALLVSRSIGVFAVDVLAIDGSAQQFYERYGFIGLQDSSQHLYLAMQTVEAMFAE